MKKYVSIMLIAIFCISLLAGCGGSGKSDQQPAEETKERAAQPEKTEETGAKENAADASADPNAYLVYVLDAETMAPIPGARVQFCSDTMCQMGKTDENGVTSFQADPGTYTVHMLKVPEGYVYNTLVTVSSDYNNERIAMELMGFGTTENVTEADAVVGGYGLDEESLAAVQTGIPYVGFTANAVEIVQESLLPDLEIDSADGVDCLGYVTYPEETLVNASYIMDGDDVFYAEGTNYFTDLPEGSKILVQRDGSRAPLEGVFHGDDESTDAFLNGIMGFSYEGKDKDGNDVNITLFANSLTESGHQRDEYAFISNALFSSFLTQTPYVTAAGE